MTIVDKVINILQVKGSTTLKAIYKLLPEHSEASIRGNLNRYLSKNKAPKIKRLGKGLYSSVEILKVSEEDGVSKISFSNTYFYNDKEIAFFHKDYECKDVESLKEETYVKKSEFSGYDDMINNMESLQSTIVKSDVREVLKKLKDESFSLLVTDPPYPVISGGKPKKKGQPSGMLSKNDGKIFEHNDISFDEWIPEVYRVLKEGSHAYIFTNLLNLEKLLESCKKVGFYLHNLLVWEKNNATPNRWYMKNHEYVLFLKKGKAKSINNKGSKTVHQFNNIIGDKIHPTEKPLNLIQFYVENSSNVGDWLLDPFGGSMATVVAGLMSGRKVFSIELDNDFFKSGIERVKNFFKVGEDMSPEMRGLLTCK